MSGAACAKEIIDSGGENDGQSTCFVGTVGLLADHVDDDFMGRVLAEDRRHRAVRADQLHELLVAGGLAKPHGRATPGAPADNDKEDRR